MRRLRRVLYPLWWAVCDWAPLVGLVVLLAAVSLALASLVVPSVIPS